MPTPIHSGENKSYPKGDITQQEISYKFTILSRESLIENDNTVALQDVDAKYILHGLWLDFNIPNLFAFPSYCVNPNLVQSDVVIEDLYDINFLNTLNSNITPQENSVHWAQHEWVKHGVCIYDTKKEFFDQIRILYARYKDIDLSTLPAASVGTMDEKIFQTVSDFITLDSNFEPITS